MFMTTGGLKDTSMAIVEQVLTPKQAVCVRPNWTSLCSQLLQDTPVSVATVIAFPEGTQDLSYVPPTSNPNFQP